MKKLYTLRCDKCSLKWKSIYNFFSLGMSQTLCIYVVRIPIQYCKSLIKAQQVAGPPAPYWNWWHYCVHATECLLVTQLSAEGVDDDSQESRNSDTHWFDCRKQSPRPFLRSFHFIPLSCAAISYLFMTTIQTYEAPLPFAKYPKVD